MVRSFFLLSNFLAAENYELSQSTSHLLSVPLTPECVRNLSLSISFFSNSIVSLMMFCVRLLSELMILFSAHHVTNHLTCCNKLTNCNVILKRKIFGKYFYFSSAPFGFWSVKIWYLKLSVKLKVIY